MLSMRLRQLLAASPKGLATAELAARIAPNADTNATIQQQAALYRQLLVLKHQHYVYPKNNKWILTSRGRGA